MQNTESVSDWRSILNIRQHNFTTVRTHYKNFPHISLSQEKFINEQTQQQKLNENTHIINNKSPITWYHRWPTVGPAQISSHLSPLVTSCEAP